MAQLQRVSWRSAGYAALGTAVAVASVVLIIRSDGVRPTSLTSSAATRWLVDQGNKTVVLADGLSGRVVARIDAKSEATDEVAVQGAGGAFLVAPRRGTVRTISTAKLQLGTAQVVASLSTTDARYGVGTSGLTVVNSKLKEASIVAVGDVTRPITVPQSKSSIVAADGSIWLFTQTQATHVNIDESTKTVQLSGRRDQTTTVGSHAVVFDSRARIVHWLDGSDVSVASLANAADAVLQEPGDDAPCVWLGVDNTLACVGATGIDRTIPIDGMALQPGDRLAIAGTAGVVVRQNNEIARLDIEGHSTANDAAPTVRPDAPKLTITTAGDMVWIDDQPGKFAWVVHPYGISTIKKNDESAPLLDAQGQVKPGSGAGGASSAGGNQPGDVTAQPHRDDNGHDDPPVAVADSVTARAGTTVIVPVTGNDYDPDGNAIAVIRVGDVIAASHGTTDVLNGTSVAYVPDKGYSGSDSFQYEIVDENGNEAHATVSVELFPADSPNRPPIARPDHATTRLGHPVTIDVLANDVDPERDTLTVPTFRQNGSAIITDTLGPSRLPALLYNPPPGEPGIYTFTYQAADPQGGISQETLVTVEVSGDNAQNGPPVAFPDSTRLRVGVTSTLDVKANDVDPDGDEMTIALGTEPKGVTVQIRGQQLAITLQPGANERSVVVYKLTDGIAGHETTGRVLVLKIGDTAENRAPVANPDVERVVIGNSVKIPVTANDIDPDHDTIRLLSVEQPDHGAGTTTVEANSVRFTPNLPDITEPTLVTFSYRISDGKSHTAEGKVSVTVLAEALPQAPFARDDFADTVTDKPVNIDVLANDTDPSGGQPSLLGTPSCPNGGIATTTDDQRVTFDPPAGQVGLFRCKYRVSNTQGLRAEATIIITVNPAPAGNHDPVMDTAQPLETVTIDGSIPLNANDFASDPDHDPLVFTSVDKPTTGSTDFAQPSESFSYLAPLSGAGEITPEAASLDVTISDQHGGNVSGTISIRIIANPTIPNKPSALSPPSDIIRTVTFGEAASTTIPVVTFLGDSNPGATLSLQSATVDFGSPAAKAEIRGGDVVITPAATGTVVVTYVFVNTDKLTQSGKIRLIVLEPVIANPSPVAADDVLSVPSGGVNSVNILANDSGIADTGDLKVPTVILSNRPPVSFGTVDLSNGFLTFTAAPNAAGTAVMHYTLNDGTSVSPAGSITITILACSDSPPAAQAARIFTPYQTPIDIDLTQYVTSGAIRPGSIAGAGLTGPTGRYTPPAGLNGSETVTYTVENGCGQTADGRLTIDVNRVPVAGTINRNLVRGATFTLAVSDLASDDEPLQITTINGNPAWVSSNTTSISATPPASTPSGIYTFTAAVADPGGLTAIATINLGISNLAPIALADAYPTKDSLITFNPTINDSDPEGGPLCVQTVAWTPPSDVTILRSGPDGCQNLITVPLGHGISTLSYTIVDDGGLTATSTITITSNNPPTVADITDMSNQPTFHETLIASDPDGDPLVATCNPTSDFDVQVTPDPNAGPPGEQRFDLAITVLNTTLPDPFVATFPCTVTDTFGATAVSTVTLTID